MMVYWWVWWWVTCNLMVYALISTSIIVFSRAYSFQSWGVGYECGCVCECVCECVCWRVPYTVHGCGCVGMTVYWWVWGV